MVTGLLLQVQDPKMWLVAKGALDSARCRGDSVLLYAYPIERSFAGLDGGAFSNLFGRRGGSDEGLSLVFCGPAMLEHAERLEAEGLPVVLVARRRGDLPWVTSDNRGAMRAIVGRLVGRGHREIAFLGGPPGNFAGEERRRGFLEGLADAGIHPRAGLMLRGDYDEEIGRRALAESLAAGARFTALVAANDLSAMGAMEALAAAGLRTGEDVEVTGFDNIPRAHWCSPTLSSFDAGLYQMGFEAREMLRLAAERGRRPAGRLVPARYVARRSTREPEEEEERRQPLEIDYEEQRFQHNAHMELILRDEEGRALSEELLSGEAGPEACVATARRLLAVAGRLGFGAACLYPMFRDMVRGEALERVMSRLASAHFQEQSRAVDMAGRYMALTQRMRELSFQAAEEQQVMGVLRDTFAALGLARAGVQLFRHPSRKGEPMREEGEWWDWEQTRPAEFAPREAARFDPSQLKGSGTAASWLLMPLLYDDELSGIVALDAAGAFTTQLPDLVRLFSVALRSARTRAALAKANSELVETSRLAGLAEMATGVLHNIGNALSSVSTSAGAAVDIVRSSRVAGVARAARLLEEHREDLAEFLGADPRGRQLPEYLSRLGRELESERGRLGAELAGLRERVEHISALLAAQQEQALGAGATESIQAEELLEFALGLCAASLGRGGITVERDYALKTTVRVQRLKLVQILVNLIGNARDAMIEGDATDKKLLLRTCAGVEGRLLIQVGDNGIGITPEQMGRLFEFGYTTKRGGHGFGLHNSRLAAREMGCALTAESAGRGLGALFCLELPLG